MGNYLSLLTGLAGHFALKKDRPTILVWSLTNRCNLNCTYCGLPGLDHQDLSREKLLSLLDSAYLSGTRLISLTGGEPMVSLHFKEFVERARELGILLSLNTNGLMVERNIEFIKKNFAQVVVSLDGPIEINDLQRGAGSGRKALEAIRVLQKNKVKNYVTVVITKDNFKKLDQVIELAIENKFSCSFQIVSDESLSFDKEVANKLNTDEVIWIADELLKLKMRYGQQVRNSVSEIEFIKKQILTPKKLHCRAGEIFARVEPNGDLRKCGRVKDLVLYSDVMSKGFLESFQSLQKFDHCLNCSSSIAIKTNLGRFR